MREDEIVRLPGFTCFLRTSNAGRRTSQRRFGEHLEGAQLNRPSCQTLQDLVEQTLQPSIDANYPLA